MPLLPDSVQAPRLTLRRWAADDVDVMAAAIADSIEHLRPWMAWVEHEPMERDARLAKIAEWEAAWLRGNDVGLAAFLDRTVVGSGGLHRRAGPDTLEIGYWIHPAHTRRGYATEISAALTTAAFAVDGIDRVEIHHDKANVASAGVPRALGYTLVGEEPDEIVAPAEVGIDCAWVMTRDQWAARR